MSVHQYDINAIETRTGLSRSFINKCNRRLASTLSRFRIKGDRNKLLYNDDGLRMWDVIKQEKEKGSNIPQIQKALEQIIQPTNQPEQSSIQTRTTETDNQQSDEGEGRPSNTQALIDAMVKINKELRDETRDQYKETQQALQGQITVLKQQMLLLTDGRSPKEVQQELWKSAEYRVELGRLRKTNQRAQELVSELEGLIGKWGKGKRMREILTQIKHLETK